jgi:hypothetical protein
VQRSYPYRHGNLHEGRVPRPCGYKYTVTNWIPKRPAVGEVEPNCECVDSIWPRTPDFFDNRWFFR